MTRDSGSGLLTVKLKEQIDGSNKVVASHRQARQKGREERKGSR